MPKEVGMVPRVLTLCEKAARKGSEKILPERRIGVFVFGVRPAIGVGQLLRGHAPNNISGHANRADNGPLHFSYCILVTAQPRSLGSAFHHAGLSCQRYLPGCVGRLRCKYGSTVV